VRAHTLTSLLSSSAAGGRCSQQLQAEQRLLLRLPGQFFPPSRPLFPLIITSTSSVLGSWASTQQVPSAASGVVIWVLLDYRAHVLQVIVR
jgi:hypothetical protein